MLAGGRARRLPGKLDLAFDESSILTRVLAVARAFAPTYVCIAEPSLAARFTSDGMKPIVDPEPSAGPLEALKNAFRHMAADTVFVLAGDMPLFTLDAARQLEGALDAHADAAVPIDATGRIHPLSALYRRRAFLSAASNGSGAMRKAVERLHSPRFVRLRDERVLENINTGADYDRVRKVLS